MKKAIGILVTSVMLTACSTNNEKTTEIDLTFPYQAYLDNVKEDQVFPIIGYDGEGFNAISNHISYPEMPDSLSTSLLADSLLQIYNISLAFNSAAYDIGTAERYISDKQLCLKYANALDSINLSGVKVYEIKGVINRICNKSAQAIREGKKPNDQNFPEIPFFYDVFHEYLNTICLPHLDYSEFDASQIIPNYKDIHCKTLEDTTTYRMELLNQVLLEKDFQKQCILAQEFAYSNYISPYRDDIQLITILDALLKEGKYSPLLGKLWRMWRCFLQSEIFGSRSNDGAIYNLFYNHIKNQIALVYIAYIKNNPNDKLAYKEFTRLIYQYNIVRNSEYPYGNNSNLEELDLFVSEFNPEFIKTKTMNNKSQK